MPTIEAAGKHDGKRSTKDSNWAARIRYTKMIARQALRHIAEGFGHIFRLPGEDDPVSRAIWMFSAAFCTLRPPFRGGIVQVRRDHHLRSVLRLISRGRSYRSGPHSQGYQNRRPRRAAGQAQLFHLAGPCEAFREA